MSTPRTPTTPAGWAIWAWGVGGVSLILLQAIVRLSPMAFSVLDGSLTSVQWGLCALWTLFMLYSEGWRGFHKQFSPRVVVRSLRIAEEPTPYLVVLAPLIAMGLLHGTRKRLIVSRTLLAGIIVLIVLVRQLPEPWRAIVDVGVVLGLVAGTLSMWWFAVWAVLGQPPDRPAEFPGEDQPTAV